MLATHAYEDLGEVDGVFGDAPKFLHHNRTKRLLPPSVPPLISLSAIDASNWGKFDGADDEISLPPARAESRLTSGRGSGLTRARPPSDAARRMKESAGRIDTLLDRSAEDAD